MNITQNKSGRKKQVRKIENISNSELQMRMATLDSLLHSEGNKDLKAIPRINFWQQQWIALARIYKIRELGN